MQPASSSSICTLSIKCCSLHGFRLCWFRGLLLIRSYLWNLTESKEWSCVLPAGRQHSTLAAVVRFWNKASNSYYAFLRRKSELNHSKLHWEQTAVVKLCKLAIRPSYRRCGGFNLRQICTASVDFPQGRMSLSTMFSEKCLLDDAEMETRKLSRQFDIPLDYTHSVFWLAPLQCVCATRVPRSDVWISCLILLWLNNYNQFKIYLHLWL